jgi:Fe-S-cluster containining protein
MRERPCPFLKDNRCAVYEYRPANCRDYPYLYKPDFTARTLSMIGRLAECPAVFEAWEELKRAAGFRYRPRQAHLKCHDGSSSRAGSSSGPLCRKGEL